MTWTPPASPTSTYAPHQNGNGNGSHGNKGGKPPRRRQRGEGEKKLIALIEKWREADTYPGGFGHDELSPHFTLQRIGVTRTRIYPYMDQLCADYPELVHVTEEVPKRRWSYSPARPAPLDEEEEG